MDNELLFNYIKQQLIQLGISPVHKGYIYLAQGIGICVQRNDCIYNLINEVYKVIAQYHDTTYQCVERDIRHTIRVFVNRKHIDALNKLLGATLYTKHDYPSCGELIGYLAEYVRLHYRGYIPAPDKE